MVPIAMRKKSTNKQNKPSGNKGQTEKLLDASATS
jgi:hypothetical protein